MVKELSKRVLKLVKKGNKNAFEKLVQHYQQPVYQFCCIVIGDEKEAEELATETFVYVYAHISAYSAKEKAFSLWLFQTVVCLREKRISKVGMDGMTCSGDSFHQTDQQMYTIITLFLHYAHELSFQEIGEVVDISNTKIQMYISRNQAMLKGYLEYREQVQGTS